LPLESAIGKRLFSDPSTVLIRKTIFEAAGRFNPNFLKHQRFFIVGMNLSPGQAA